MGEAPRFDQVPARKGQRIEIVKRVTHDQAVWIFACCDSKRCFLGLAADYEITGAIEECR